jgi:hypothetical protein
MLKNAYETLVVDACSRDICMIGQQRPKSVEDVNQIYLSEDHQELVKSNLPEVCRRKYAWYEVHKNPGHDS